MTNVDPGKLAVREAPRPKPKRVYKAVSIEADGGQWRILLDRKTLSTPMRKPLVTTAKSLAEAIAAEWDAQKVHVEPETMPLTRLLSTAIDKVTPDRAGIIAELMRYVDSDMLCYRATHPADLRARQGAIWQPVLDWVAATTGAKMAVVHGIVPLRQHPETAAALERAKTSLSDIELTAFQAAAAITSSLALSLALVRQRLTAAEVFAAAQLDESYQIEKWGEDELAMQRRAGIAADTNAIEAFLKLCGS